MGAASPLTGSMANLRSPNVRTEPTWAPAGIAAKAHTFLRTSSLKLATLWELVLAPVPHDAELGRPESCDYCEKRLMFGSKIHKCEGESCF